MATDQKILTAAAALFFEKGFARVGVDDIGARAGVTGPAVYHHFKGKDEILATLFDEAIDGITRMTSVSSPNPREELEQRVRKHAEYVIGNQKLSSVWAREDRSLSDYHRKRLHRRQSAYVQSWADTIGRCYSSLSTTDAMRAAVMALGTLNSVSQWPPAAVVGAELADRLAQFVLGGLDAFVKANESISTG